MMAIPTMPVMAASDKDVLGDWYANIYGVGIQVTFRKGGSYLISMDGVNNGDPEEGTWKMTGDAITLDEGEENSMNLTVKGNSISADSGEFTLSREETEYDGYTPAKVVDADEKDFVDVYPFVPYQFNLLQRNSSCYRRYGRNNNSYILSKI